MLIVACWLAQGCFAIAVPAHNSRPVPNAADIYIHAGKNGKQISLLELSMISRHGLEELTGRKMNFIERASFHITQKKLRKGIDGSGRITDWKLQKALGAGGQKGFHAGGFFLGLLLGPIGVIIAYLIKDEKKRNRVKWAWIGFGIWTVALILFAVALNSLFTFN